MTNEKENQRFSWENKIIKGFPELKWTGKGDLSTNSDICVFSETTRYRVTITGEYSDFSLRSGANTIPFELKWNDSATTQGNTTVNYNIPLLNQHNADSNYENCNGGVNANLEVNFSASDLEKANAGDYSGYLTIIIEPEG